MGKFNPFSPRGVGTLIFSYIRRLGPFFGFKILNFNSSEKLIFLLFIYIFFFFFWGGGGVEDFVDIILGSSQNWTSFRGHFHVF